MSARKALTYAVIFFLIIVASLTIIFAPHAASAHTGAVTGTAECEADGTYTVTWTYNATNVPDGTEAETKVIKHLPDSSSLSHTYLSVWTEHQVNQPGVPVRTGNWSASFTQSGIPGSATQAEVMVQTDWLNGPSEDPVGTVPLDGACTEPEPEPIVYIPLPPTVDCDGVNLPSDTAEVTYTSLGGDGNPYTVTATANEGYILTLDNEKFVTTITWTLEEPESCNEPPVSTPTPTESPTVTPSPTEPTTPPGDQPVITTPTDTTDGPSTESNDTEEDDTEELAVTGPDDVSTWLIPVGILALAVGVVLFAGSLARSQGHGIED